MSGELLSSGPEADQERRVRRYFLKPESRILYRLFLRGTKHFGYYPPGSRRLSMASAMRMMEDKLGTTLKLPPGSRVLDAGCGEGDVAIRMATRFGLHVDGVDLLEFSLDKARKKARKLGLEDLLRLHRMDYADLRSRTRPSTAPTRWRPWYMPSIMSERSRSCSGCSSPEAGLYCSSTPSPRDTS
jgi:SAM-dependent methyltransferase